MNAESLVVSPTQIGVIALVSPAARALAAATAQRTMPPFLNELLAAGLAGDALLAVPYTMPPRAAIWWACICAWHACARAPTPAENNAFQVVVDWVRSPSQRSAAPEVDQLQTPLGCCLFAIKLSERASDDRNALRGIAKILGYSAQLSLQQSDRSGIPSSLEQFVLFGMDVSAGKVPWSVRLDG